MPRLSILHGCRTVQLTRGKNTLIDEADWSEISSYRWRAEKSGQFTIRWYAVRSLGPKSDRRQARLHRALCPGDGVDHKNGDGLDNRRSNLRTCTHFQNGRNRRASWGSSRFKGVYFDNSRGNWAARIRFPPGKNKYLGAFGDEREAAMAYDQAAKKYFGEFACTNVDLVGDY